jgi:hypothetical protein
MKKTVVALLALTIIVSCGEKKSTKNTQITGNIKGLKKGTLYLQRIVDSKLIAFDTINIDGDSYFESDFDLQSPEMLYLSLDRGKTNSIDNNILFFAEPGTIHIETELELFYANAKIIGSKNQDLYDNFKKVNAKFIDQQLFLTEARFKAIKSNNTISIDSIAAVEKSIVKRKYLYAINFAINNRNFEVSPYIALAEISDVNFKYLDTIQKAMSPKVAQSLYGKKLTAYYSERKKLKQ